MTVTQDAERLLTSVKMTLMGIVQNVQGLYAARFFLGVAESGFFPGATYLLTIWYKRYEVQGRMAIFYAAASLSGAFSGLLAYAIEQMSGVAGLGGWQWVRSLLTMKVAHRTHTSQIFILEGIIPVAISFFIWKILPDSPETASFLTAREKEYIINRLALDTGSGSGKVTNSDKITMRHILDAFKQYQIYGAVVMFWANTIGVCC